MLPKRLDVITYGDFLVLLANQVRESTSLEYKRDAVGPRPGDRHEFAEDVASFANTAGGDIVFGVTEDAGVPIALNGVAVTDVDAEILRMDSIIKDSIEPRVSGVRIQPVYGGPGPIIIVRIPRSWSGLHMVIANDMQRFVARNNAGKYRLDVHQIRAGFLAGAEIGERASEFRDRRVLAVRTMGGAPVPLVESGAPRGIIAHFIPASSFRPGTHIDLARARSSGSLLAFYPTGANLRFNIDGILAKGDWTYTTLFRSGVMESASGDVVGRFVKGLVLAENLVGAVRRYLRLGGMLDIAPPVFILATIFGISGVELESDYGGLSYDASKFDRDVVNLPDIVLEALDVDVPQALKPMLDGLWQAAGRDHCELYDEHGVWNPRR